jgi:hypothetical protein
VEPGERIEASPGAGYLASDLRFYAWAILGSNQ